MMPSAHPDTASSSLSPVPAAAIESAATPTADNVKECGSELERLQLACTYLEKANDDLRSNLNEINHRFVSTEPPEDHCQHQHNLTSFFIEHKQPSAAPSNDDMEFEVDHELAFKIRSMMQEHEVLNQNNIILHDQVEKCRTELNRALTSKMQLEEELRRMKLQHENFLRDYEETMHERSTVLEENNRLHEEKESLKAEVKQLNQTMASLISVKAQKAEAQARYGSRSEAELHDEEAANAKLRVAEEGFMNIEKWQYLTISIHFPNPNKNLGLVLGGGRDDEILGSSTPIYVHSISAESTFGGQLQRLDHVVVVNDINVSMMDQRSVIEILANSQHLKMLIKRPSNQCVVVDVPLARHQDVEFENGVYISRVNEASDCVLRPGTRVVHVNHLPVYDSHQVERLIQKLDGPLTIGLLRRRVKKDDEQQSTAPETPHVGRPKHKFLNKLFGRSSGASAEKARAIIAQANIDASARDLLTYRHGSLRLPSSRTSFRGELCRTASLRGPPSTRSADGKTIFEKATPETQHEPKWGQSSGSGCTWPSEVISSSIPEDVAKPRPFQQAHKRRSVLPIFSPAKPSPSTSTVLSDYSSRPTSAFRPIGGESAHLITSPGNLSQPSVMGLVHAQRVMGCSPSLPQPPPYPGPKSSVDSLNITSTSSFTQNNSSSFLSTKDGTTDSITNEMTHSPHGETRTVYLSNESGKIGLELEDSMGGVVVTNVWGDAEGKVNIGEQLIDICGINMRSATKMSAQRIMAFLSENNNPITLVVRQSKERPRRVSVLRKSLELCGGNVIGILIKNSIGPLRPGDRILQLDDLNTRSCTLEEAVSTLDRNRETMVSLLVQHDYERYVRLQNGTEGDGFYVRVNINRAGGSADELDLRIGDILFVDNTLFMGAKGRWRAWRIDQEGRQRQCGIIPSEVVIEDMIKRFRQNAKKWQLPEATPIYEHIERVAPSKKRPLILFGALVDPFLQRLLDEYPTQFAQCVPEFRVLSTSAADVSKNSSEYVEIRRRDKLFEVITYSNLHDIMNHNLHCVMEISPQAVARLHAMRIYPILIRIKFKTVKQMKELSEDIGERIANKQGKERFDKAKEVDNDLEQLKLGVNNVIVSSQANYRNALRHICVQIVSIVEHEQKRTVWVPKGRRIPI
ncbi:hypothetical protein QR680_003318 [Steinernema hermaphroditum]|uniref:PDZ domain-containing protein n=1 Tax=Steinernema hermaphroditum TaxID=289476 RepID=A0AA39LJI0_9BILA|nr:hypothetical protein QR680_003318 [Steinernema hermaphroditum]